MDKEVMVKEETEGEKESISFSVQMTAKEVFRFSFHHSYFKLAGLIGIIMSLTAIVILISCYSQLEDKNKAILLIVGLWFTILEPLTIWSRSNSQAKRNPAYKKALHYTMNGEGITVSQDEQSQSIAWERLMKIVETKYQYLVYSSKIHAFVFPKTALGDKREEVERMMFRYTEGTKVKVSSGIKKRNK